MTTWRKLLSEALEEQGESWSDVVSMTLTGAQLDKEFYDGYGGAEGDPFTVWTVKRVYFPTEYDGSESVASVSRDPDGIPTPHSGFS